MLYARQLLPFVIAATAFVVACADGADAPVANESSAAGSQISHAINIEFKSEPSPPRSGENMVEVIVTNSDGSPLSDAIVAATFYMPAMPSMNMPEMRSVVALKSEGGGRYRGNGRLVMSGTWEVTVSVTRGAERLASKKLTVIAK